MGIVPQTQNAAAQDAVNVLQTILTDVFEKGLDAYLRAQAPWLNFWGISYVYSAILDKLTQYVYQFLAQWTVIGVVDVQTWVESSNYAGSVVSLKAARDAAMASMDAAAKQQNAQAVLDAQAKFKQDFQNLVHWDGSATP